MRNLVWVDTLEGLLAMVEEARRHPTVALDAEMDSYFVYHTKLCLLQLSCGQIDYLVDCLAIKDLRALNLVTTDPAIRKVVHAGQNDIPYFRGRGVNVVNLFDTHIASKLLGLESQSLAGLVGIYFGVALSKEQQRADWRLRPLPPEQVAYARQDTQYLNDLADLLFQELGQVDGLWREAEQAFKSLESFEVRKKEWDANGWLKIKGASELRGLDRNVLAALFAWRERAADEEDVALFRIVSNWELVALARKKIAGPREIAAWTRNNWLRERAYSVFQLIKKARTETPLSLKDLKRPVRNGLSVSEQELFDRLRKWRNEESTRKGVEPERVFSNRQLKVIARMHPANLGELDRLEGIEPWRLEEFSGDVLEIIRAKG